MKEQLFNEKWEKDFNSLQESIKERINNESVKVKRNSFLEPFDSRSYMDLRVGVPHGMSYIVDNGRCILGTVSESKIK